jgi:excisionase family DNA binding protein
MLTVTHMSAESNIGEPYWYAEIAAGRLPAVRLGRLIRVEREAFERYLSEHAA